jgi:hypothetical protein
MDRTVTSPTDGWSIPSLRTSKETVQRAWRGVEVPSPVGRSMESTSTPEALISATAPR